MCRVLFGVTSSPFMLSVALIKHLKKYRNADSEFFTKILDSSHVDDLNSGVNSRMDAYEFYCKRKDRLSDASFNLRKFQSNDAELEELIKNHYDEENEVLDENKTKVLGINWDKACDFLNFDFEDIKSKFQFKIVTKRKVLQALASVFDPLGLINSIIVKLKVYFQKLCISKTEWDTPLDEKLLHEWNLIVSEFDDINAIFIDRNYCYQDESDPFHKVQMHGFCDVS